MTATLSHRKELCFWGWGYMDEALLPAEVGQLAQLAGGLGAGTEPGPAPVLEEFRLSAPRIAASETLSSILSATSYDRVTHGG